MKFAVPRSVTSFIPRTKRKYIYFPGLEKDYFPGHTPKSVNDPYLLSSWIFKLNTSLVQIPVIPEYFVSRVSKKIIFEVTL